MQNGKEETVRARIAELLRQNPAAAAAPHAASEPERAAVIAELRLRRPEDLEGRLAVAGFQDHPGVDGMRCQECEQFDLDRKVCLVPDIALPVRADWWCRLWRI